MNNVTENKKNKTKTVGSGVKKIGEKKEQSKRPQKEEDIKEKSNDNEISKISKAKKDEENKNKENEITNLKLQVKDLNEQLAKLLRQKDNEIKKRDLIIEELKRKIDEIAANNNRDIRKKEEEISKKELIIKDLAKKLTIKGEVKWEEMYIKQLEYYEGLITEKDLKIDNQKKEIDRLKSLGDAQRVQELPLANYNTSIKFISVDQQINDNFDCNEDESFSRVEEKLYAKYPQYKETDNFFLVNSMKVFRFKTIKENKIMRGQKVMLYTPGQQ